MIKKVVVFFNGTEKEYDNRIDAVKEYADKMVKTTDDEMQKRCFAVLADLSDGYELCVDKYDEYLLAHPDMVACPYCHRPMAKTNNPDELCDDCKMVFGHSLVTEL